jgi:hypothetical protein
MDKTLVRTGEVAWPAREAHPAEIEGHLNDLSVVEIGTRESNVSREGLPKPPAWHRVEPLVKVEVLADHAVDVGRWRHTTQFLRTALICELPEKVSLPFSQSPALREICMRLSSRPRLL